MYGHPALVPEHVRALGMATGFFHRWWSLRAQQGHLDLQGAADLPQPIQVKRAVESQNETDGCNEVGGFVPALDGYDLGCHDDFWDRVRWKWFGELPKKGQGVEPPPRKPPHPLAGLLARLPADQRIRHFRRLEALGAFA